MKPDEFEDISFSKILHFVQGAGLLNEWGKGLRKTRVNGVDTHNIHNSNVTLCRHKYKVAVPVYLVMQLPTCQTEVKLYYMFQVSM
jgi:hypothetical protein